MPRLDLASELERLGFVSVSSSEGLGLGLASVSTKKASCTSLVLAQYTGNKKRRVYGAVLKLCVVAPPGFGARWHETKRVIFTG